MVVTGPPSMIAAGPPPVFLFVNNQHRRRVHGSGASSCDQASPPGSLARCSPEKVAGAPVAKRVAVAACPAIRHPKHTDAWHIFHNANAWRRGPPEARGPSDCCDCGHATGSTDGSGEASAYHNEPGIPARAWCPIGDPAREGWRPSGLIQAALAMRTMPEPGGGRACFLGAPWPATHRATRVPLAPFAANC
ncbi:unnamed protein product, partial [Amoebophrya sp. A120]|eukprot:GSA120T00009587001.1